MRSLIVLVPFLISVTAAAQVPVSFETSLGLLRQNVLAVRAQQVETKNASLVADINRLRGTAQWLRADLSRMRGELLSLSSRVRGAQTADSILRYDVQRFNYFLQETARKAQDLAYGVRRVDNAVTDKDPALVGPAQALASETRWLGSDLVWITNDLRSMGWDLRRIQMHMEAFDVERESRELDNQVTQADSEAQRLLSKVR
ncbi:MAG: hypothetical protein WC969_08935 [Elusimicrobiota bacterium]|jgi:hypothetical protein